MDHAGAQAERAPVAGQSYRKQNFLQLTDTGRQVAPKHVCSPLPSPRAAGDQGYEDQESLGMKRISLRSPRSSENLYRALSAMECGGGVLSPSLFVCFKEEGTLFWSIFPFPFCSLLLDNGQGRGHLRFGELCASQVCSLGANDPSPRQALSLEEGRKAGREMGKRVGSSSPRGRRGKALQVWGCREVASFVARYLGDGATSRKDPGRGQEEPLRQVAKPLRRSRAHSAGPGVRPAQARARRAGSARTHTHT